MIIAYYLWRFGSWLVTVVPAPIADFVARLCGAGSYYLWPKRRKVVRENFAHVLGKPANDPSVGRVARSAFANFCRYLVEMMRYPRVSNEQLEQRVIIHETEDFRRAMAAGTPVIVVSAHFGNMDYTSAVATKRYRRFTLAAETIHPIQLFQYLARVRSERGVDLIPYDQAPRKIMQALKRNELVGFLIDFGVNNQKNIATTEVTFFGAPTRFPIAPAILAQRTGAPILVAFTRVDNAKHIHCEVEAPIYVPRDLPRKEAGQVTMQAIAHHFEKFIRQNPEQWYVFRAMWPQPILGEINLANQLPGALGSGL
jgi:KDO2-lipid IV(A) lauroyltransferase